MFYELDKTAQEYLEYRFTRSIKRGMKKKVRTGMFSASPRILHKLGRKYGIGGETSKELIYTEFTIRFGEDKTYKGLKREMSYVRDTELLCLDFVKLESDCVFELDGRDIQSEHLEEVRLNERVKRLNRELFCLKDIRKYLLKEVDSRFKNGSPSHKRAYHMISLLFDCMFSWQLD